MTPRISLKIVITPVALTLFLMNISLIPLLKGHQATLRAPPIAPLMTSHPLKSAAEIRRKKLAESKADDTKIIFDLTSRILKSNTLDSLAFMTPEPGRWPIGGCLSVIINRISVGLAYLGEHGRSVCWKRKKKGKRKT